MFTDYEVDALTSRSCASTSKCYEWINCKIQKFNSTYLFEQEIAIANSQSSPEIPHISISLT